MLRTVCSWALAALFSSTLSAQIVDTGTGGCSNGGTIATPAFGSTSIGGSVTIANTQLPCNSIGTTSFILFNVDGSFVPGVNFSCFVPVGNPCGLLDPIIGFGAPGFTYSETIQIPNDPGLIGSTIYAQGGCLNTFMPPGGLPFCFNALNRIISITVTP